MHLPYLFTVTGSSNSMAVSSTILDCVVIFLLEKIRDYLSQLCYIYGARNARTCTSRILKRSSMCDMCATALDSMAGHIDINFEILECVRAFRPIPLDSSTIPP